MAEREMAEREIELIDLLRIIGRQKWIILVTFLAAVLAAWGGSRVVSPTYRTETSLLLLPPLSRQLGAEAVGTRLAPEAYEELSVSTSLLEQVMEAVELPSDEALDDFRERFSVSVRRLSGEGELLLRTRVSGSDPDRLQWIAMAWTTAFSDTYGELFQDRTTRSYEYVSRNYSETETQLENAIAERTAFFVETPLAALRAQELALSESVTQVTRDLIETIGELENADAYLSVQGPSVLPEPSSFVLTGDLDPTTWTGALAYGLSAIEFRDLLIQRVTDLEEAEDRVADELVKTQQAIDQAETSLSTLNRRISTLESAHGQLARKLQEAQIAVAETPDPIRVINEPSVPESPSGPGALSNMAVAGFLGLLVGTLLAFFVDYLARVREEEGRAVPATTAAKRDGTTTIETETAKDSTSRRPDRNPPDSQ